MSACCMKRKFQIQEDMMASEPDGLPENSVTYSTRNHLDTIHCNLKRELIKEKPIEIKYFSENGVRDESHQEEAEDGKFYEPVSSNCGKNPRESKPSLTHSWENASFETKCSGNIVATDDQELVQIKEEIKEDNANEDNFERTDDLLTINADLTMQTLKFEDEIDIVYEDNKPEIHGDRLSGNKSHPNTIIAKIVPRESAIDSWKNTNFDTKGSEHIFAADDQELAQIKKEIKEDNANEDNFECTDYLLKINVDLKMQVLKFEDEIDIFYEEIKPKDKLSGNKSHPNTIAEIVPGGSSFDFGAVPQQDTTVEEDETDVERDNEKQFQCKICSKCFSKSSYLKKHNGTHAGEKQCQCNYCPKSFSKSSDLKNHERTHTGEKPFQCNFCLKSFTRSSVLKSHERTHTGEKPFQCNFCRKSFMRSSDLKIHERTHTGEKPFQCNFCLKSCSQRASLKNHERTHTGEKPFQCDLCRKSFMRSRDLKIHERLHTGKKPFQCYFCLNSFSRSCDLKSHERTHTGEKPFKCNSCPKSFTQGGALTVHERTHTGEKPFQCNLCLKSFSQRASLKNHEGTHTGKKPFQCDLCRKSFLRSCDVKSHERTHTGEKLFQCIFCRKSFMRSSDLKIHERTHTGEKPFQCNFCLKSFSRRASLKNHERTHTGKKTVSV